ncbi:hypothetical protein FOA52_015346 [Chlamydomonas sp. UWO 241]|nr:hypothetical protein FOA52_015346 [Chlamydomonas sp. UWO 241]
MTPTALRDQDAHKRPSGVWNGSSDSPKETGDGRTHYSNCVPNALARQESNRGRRGEAAAFLSKLLGRPMDDAGFRAALSDGVVLSRAVNAVIPGAIKNVGGLDDSMTPTARNQRRYETVQCLIRGLAERAPPEVHFSYEDITSESEAERPRVVDCVLWLKRQHEANAPRERSPGWQPSMPGAAGAGVTDHMDVDDCVPDQCSPGSSATAAVQQQQQQRAVMATPPAAPKAPVPPPPAAPLATTLAPPPPPAAAPASVSVAPLASPVAPAVAPPPLAAAAAAAAPPPPTAPAAAAADAPALAPAAIAPPASASARLTPVAPPAAAAAVPAATAPASARLAPVAPPPAARGAAPAIASKGVAQLLTQFTTLLNADGIAAPGGSGAGGVSLEGLAPIIHNVLGSLTADYERKLAAKDMDASRQRDLIAALRAEIEDLKRQVADLQALLAEAHAALNAAGDEAERALDAALAGLRSQLDAKDSEIARLRWQIDNAGETSGAAMAELQASVTKLADQLLEAKAGEGRHKAMRDENRRLYNQVQDLKGAIRVFCRIRPAGRTGEASAACMEAGEDGELAVHDASAPNGLRLYAFDKVFGEGVSQAEVYDDVQPLIRSVLDGYNVCIFAYGQTGSGKTHTMSGTDTGNASGRGINFRALDDLFSMLEERSGEWVYTIRCQMLEVYNESLRDLLIKDKDKAGADGGGWMGVGGAAAPKLELLNTQPSGCNVRGAEQIPVMGPHEVVELMERGSRNRAVAGTSMNERSSRSHQVLTVIVDGTHRTAGTQVHACLNLVDLAGSERVKQSKAAGDRLVETCNINSSLSALGDVVAALARKDAHVPFRNSKLTQLLADSLGGSAKVMMFMHVAPEGAYTGESVSTLNFGSKAASVTLGQAKRNVDNTKIFSSEEVVRSRKEVAEKDSQLSAERRRTADATKRADALAKEVEKLKAELAAAKRQAGAGGGYSTSSPSPSARSASARRPGGGSGAGAGATGSSSLSREASGAAGDGSTGAGAGGALVPACSSASSASSGNSGTPLGQSSRACHPFDTALTAGTPGASDAQYYSGGGYGAGAGSPPQTGCGTPMSGACGGANNSGGCGTPTGSAGRRSSGGSGLPLAPRAATGAAAARAPPQDAHGSGRGGGRSGGGGAVAHAPVVGVTAARPSDCTAAQETASAMRYARPATARPATVRPAAPAAAAALTPAGTPARTRAVTGGGGGYTSGSLGRAASAGAAAGAASTGARRASVGQWRA